MRWRLWRQGPHRAWWRHRRCGCCGQMATWGAAVPLAPELRFGAAGLGRRRISRPPDASGSRGGGVWERLRCGCRWHRECRGWCAAMRTAAWLRAARAVPRCSAAQRLRALGWFADAGWQDLRAVHDSRGPCSEKGPFLARSSRGVSSDGDLRGFSDTWRAHLAKASSFWMHGVQILPRSPPFLVRGPFLDTWSEKKCHGLPPGNAPGRNLAIARRPGTHFTGILPSVSARNATAPCASTSCVAAPSMLAPNAPPMPYVPVAHAPAPRCHAPYAALLSPLKK